MQTDSKYSQNNERDKEETTTHGHYCNPADLTAPSRFGCCWRTEPHNTGPRTGLTLRREPGDLFPYDVKRIKNE